VSQSNSLYAWPIELFSIYIVSQFDYMMRDEFFAVVNKIIVFRNMTPCSPANMYRIFNENYCLHYRSTVT